MVMTVLRQILKNPVFIGVALLTLVVAKSNGQSPSLGENSVSQAIDRGLAFLARDAIAWKKEHDCSSCHHAAMVVWSMSEARLRGHATDEPVLADMTKWLTSAGEGRTSVPRPEGVPKALNTKAVYFALGLGSLPELK